jgi:hypothetical protein
MVSFDFLYLKNKLPLKATILLQLGKKGAIKSANLIELDTKYPGR